MATEVPRRVLNAKTSPYDLHRLEMLNEGFGEAQIAAENSSNDAAVAPSVAVVEEQKRVAPIGLRGGTCSAKAPFLEVMACWTSYRAVLSEANAEQLFALLAVMALLLHVRPMQQVFHVARLCAQNGLTRAQCARCRPPTGFRPHSGAVPPPSSRAVRHSRARCGQ